MLLGVDFTIIGIALKELIGGGVISNVMGLVIVISGFTASIFGFVNE